MVQTEPKVRPESLEKTVPGEREDLPAATVQPEFPDLPALPESGVNPAFSAKVVILAWMVILEKEDLEVQMVPKG